MKIDLKIDLTENELIKEIFAKVLYYVDKVMGIYGYEFENDVRVLFERKIEFKKKKRFL